MDLKLKSILYISQLMFHKRTASASSYESILRPNISDQLIAMLTALPISEDKYHCETSVTQRETEDAIKNIYMSILESIKLSDQVLAKLDLKVSQLLDDIESEEGSKPDDDRKCEPMDAELNVDLHLRYIEHFLGNPLPAGFSALDCNHGWMLYWLLNSHSLLQDGTVPENLRAPVSAKIEQIVIDGGHGGIAGGPHGQIGHAASTYASVLTLVLMEDFELLEKIKPSLYQWFVSLKKEDGSYAMHHNGESDVRSTYCVLSVAALLNILTDELLEGTVEFLLSCQTFEGGFAGTPYTEAHGGYTFCALAALYVTPQKFKNVDMSSLLRWLGARQLHVEGGFSGRSNKLVDGCYSFWIGASFALVEAFEEAQSFFNRTALKTYILNCCQDKKFGGLRDKPGKNPDFYHTNYTLSGLSIAEHTYEPSGPYNFKTREILEGATNTVDINPAFGLPVDLVRKCHNYFYSQDSSAAKSDNK